MSKKLDNVINLYLEGIRDGKVRETITKYTGARYTQHSTGVADGIEGFVAFFEPFIERNPVRDIQILRSFEDGQFVFVQAYQDLNNGEAKWVTADIFDTDKDEKIIEHWDVIQAYEVHPQSRHSMIDGYSKIEDLDKTKENKTLVANFYQNVILGRQVETINNYINPTQFIQHNPYSEGGAEGFVKEMIEGKSSVTAVKYLKIHRLIGQGSFVAAYSHTQLASEEYAVIDLYRVKDGKIVEHWSVKENILPMEKWGNSGKF